MKTIEATYENGVFRPTESVSMPAGTKVRVLVESDEELIARMKARYPNSFGIITPEEGDEMMRIIDEEFGKVDPNEWR